MGQVQGWNDFPLTSNGIAVANNLGRGRGQDFQSGLCWEFDPATSDGKQALKYSGNKKVKVNVSKYLREGGYGL